MGQSEKVERAVTLAGFLVVVRPSERDQSCLRRVDGQSEAGEPLGEDSQQASGVLFQFAANDKVIGEANQEAFAFQPGLDLLDEPIIQHPVQKDIREYG